MDNYERSKLCDAFKEENFNANEYIVKQGESGNKFYLLVNGEAYATKFAPGHTEA